MFPAVWWVLGAVWVLGGTSKNGTHCWGVGQQAGWFVVLGLLLDGSFVGLCGGVVGCLRTV